MEFVVRDLAERLVARHGWEVTVLTTNAYTNENFRDGRLPTIPIQQHEVQNGVRVMRFPVVTRWAPLLRIAQGLAWRARLPGNAWLRTWYQGPISPGLRRAAATLPADVVLAASFPLNHLRYAFGRRDHKPVVLMPSSHPWDRWGYRRRNLIALTRRAAATVAHTEPERDWLVGRGAPKRRVTVIPLGIDPEVVRTAPGAFRQDHRIPRHAYLVAYVGQQGSHKGIDVLLAALPDLLARVPDAWLAVGGAPTPYSARLRALADSLPAAARRRLVWLDGLSDRQKAELLADADVFASPSKHESFGLTVLEAWAHSKPVVVGRGPAQKWLLEDGSLGRLVPYGDAGRLAKVLAELAEKPELRRDLGQAGHRRLLERYTIDGVVDRYRDLLQSVARLAADE